MPGNLARQIRQGLLEQLKKYCSHSAKGIERAVFLVFGFVSAQLQGLSNLLLRRSLAKNQKSSLRDGYSIFLTALAGLLALTNATAAGDEWFARPWQTDDGLLDSNVHAITQTPDGYVWVATETGLSRFDGVRFQTVWPSRTSIQPENNVERLLVDTHGNFWMAMHRGNVLSVSPKSTREYSDKEGLPKTNPTALIED